MIYILILFVLLCFYKVSFSKGKNYFDDYLSKDKTASIKGIFICLVFFSHFASYVNLSSPIDVPFERLCGMWGQSIVTMFLFYSGYGVMESIKKNSDYILNIPRKRILGVLINFDLAVLLFLLVQVSFGKHIAIKKILLSLVAWESLGNSNWYIFAILATYLFTYISFSLIKGNKTLGALGVTFFSIIFILVMRIYRIEYWYNTILCYPLGMFYSIYKEKIETVLFRRKPTFYLCLILSAVVFYISHMYFKRFFIYQIWIFSFVAIVLLITMKISFDNKPLRYLGENLFGIYVLQRIPMIVFKAMGVESINVYLYFSLCVISTLILSFFFNKLTALINTNFISKSCCAKTQIGK